jgi:hypothetical protein
MDYAHPWVHFADVPISASFQNVFSEQSVESLNDAAQIPEDVHEPSLFSLSTEPQDDPVQMPEHFHDMRPVDPVSDTILIALTEPFLMAWCTGDPPRLGFVPMITDC